MPGARCLGCVAHVPQALEPVVRAATVRAAHIDVCWLASNLQRLRLELRRVLSPVLQGMQGKEEQEGQCAVCGAVPCQTRRQRA